MGSRKTQSSLIKRAGTDFEDERSRKRLSPFIIGVQDDERTGEKDFEFRVLLPNGNTVDLKIHRKGGEVPLEEFVNWVKHESLSRTSGPKKHKRIINWKDQNLHLVDAYENKITMRLKLDDFEPNKCHILRLNDGSGNVDTYENMWDLTPATDVLRELPEAYTCETALADLIDNSLQAVWSNKTNERRLISVKITKSTIEIFDTGPGMDGSHENSLVQWGKMGASSHRLVKGQAIGGKPPYLMPFFGMFGYGGFIASMKLGRRALVSSKTKQSKKVYVLDVDREALLRSSSQQSWRAKGGCREPSKGEIEKASHGSFTKVEIFESSQRCMDIRRLQFALKDIYFPYIQSDEVSNTGRTVMPIEFQVNGTDLAEIGSGEVAVTNLLSCNGPEFTLQLHFSPHTISTSNRGLRARCDANARIKCVYFPIIQGKETITRILERLEEDGCGIAEDYKSFSHVSIRRLGRLLPDARWAWLPFMEPKQRKGNRGQILKRCCFRVKCFIDTDAGFDPTASKTDLAHHHPYTTALKNFGVKTLDKEKDAHISITKDGKKLSLTQLEKQYIDWISQMHDDYDEEVDSGEDEPIFIVGTSNKKELGISSEVFRVHKLLQRKGNCWKSGQRVKVMKGACAGYHKTNTYATLEYIILENMKGDAGGEARLICRPIGVPDESGCTLIVNDGNTSIDIRRSISLPVSVIDSGKFVAVKDAEWECQIEKCGQKALSSIDVLSSTGCQDLGIEGEVPGDVIDAGFVPPKEIVAVIRPASFNAAAASNHLDQNDIAEENLEMTVEITFGDENDKAKRIFSRQIIPSSRNGFRGLYILPLRRELSKLFQKAGCYTFLFSLRESSCRNFVKTVQVQALSKVGSWGLLSDKITKFSARVGSCFPPCSIACYDRYCNRIPFPCDTKAMIRISASKDFTALTNMKQSLSSNSFSMTIKDVLVESYALDKIRPSYEAKFLILSQDESLSVEIQCQVLPGVAQHVSIQPPKFGKQLLPGQIITDLVLEIFDAYNNHVREHETIILEVDGFCVQKRDSTFEVDENGCLNLSGLLKVNEGYGKSVSFSVLSYDSVIFKEVFQTERRELRAAFELPIFCSPGTQLENLIFEVINTEGEVDENIHNEDRTGQSHTLTLRSDSLKIDDSLRYSFSYGRCTVQSIPLPVTKGIFYFEAIHSYHPELHFSIEVHIEQAVIQEHENLLTQSSERKIVPFQGCSGIESSKLEDVDVHNQTSHERLQLPDMSEPSFVGNLVEYMTNYDKVLFEDICHRGLCINQLEENMKLLNVQQSIIEGEICNLKAGLDLDYSHDRECTSEKELVMEQIARKSGSAAAVICRIFQKMSIKKHLERNKDFLDNILGVVGCLGRVQTNDLSRILAKYLGEDQMLAIVCKSSAYASNLVKYEHGGRVNSAYGLHAIAAELGLPINRQYVVICLDNIRGYAGEICSGSQRKLALPDPTSSKGKPLPGYLGYAVNMIDPDISHWNWKIPSGCGLRETLFYRLFGELQVYETREDMNKATSCITEGAVSLDGGITKNGVFTLGYWEPDIRFPTICSQSQRHMSGRSVEIMKQIEEKQRQLHEVADRLKGEQETCKKVMKKFKKKRDQYRNFLKEHGPLLGQCARPKATNNSSD